MADGTGIPTGRVGSCHIHLNEPLHLFVKAFFMRKVQRSKQDLVGAIIKVFPRLQNYNIPLR